MAILCLLMLRGPQTPGELKQRSERLHPFPDLAAVEGTLARLGERGHVARLERRPGQKEDRYAQLLGGEATAWPDRDARARTPDEGPSTRAAAAAPVGDGVEARLAGLEAEVAELREELAALRRELGA